MKNKETPLDGDGTGFCFQQLQKDLIVDWEDNQVLAKQAKKGNADSLERLAIRNLPIVLSEAKKYYGLPYVDKVQEGSIGLLKSIPKFDPEKGVQFNTHATWWVSAAIRRAIENQSRNIRIPSHLYPIKKIVVDLIAEKEREFGRPPSAAEILEEVLLAIEKKGWTRREGYKKIDEKKVALLMDHIKGELSLDQPIKDNDQHESSFGDFISDPRSQDDFNRFENSQMVNQGFKLFIELYNDGVLNDEDREFIFWKYKFDRKQTKREDLKPRTNEEVGRKMKCSKETARNRIEEALEKLRKSEVGEKILQLLKEIE